MNKHQFKQLRKAITGLHPLAIAERMNITRSMIYFWEDGSRKIPAKRAEQLIEIATESRDRLNTILGEINNG